MADAKKPMDEADREHTLLLRILQPTQPPAEKFALATLDNYLGREVDALIAQPGKGYEEGMVYLAKCWRKSGDGCVPSTWTGIAQFQDAIMNVALVKLASACTEDKARIVLGALHADAPPKLMNAILAAAVDDAELSAKVLVEVAKPLRGQMLNSLNTPQMHKLLTVLKSSKKFVAALTASPCLEEIWRPPFEPKFNWKNKKGEVVSSQRPGNVLQNESLLGWVLSPSGLDGAVAPPSKASMTESGSSQWAHLQRVSQGHIHNLQNTTRMKMNGVQETALDLVQTILKGGDGPRFAVLEWLGVLLASAELRGQQGHMAPEGFNFWPHGGHHIIDVLGNDRNSRFDRSFPNMLLLQSLHARIYGFPTSGVALNAFALLLNLAKPIKTDFKTDGFSKISPFFTLRSDIPDMLGSWKPGGRESRFGENEQLEKATEEAKAQDRLFSAGPNTKDVFQTEIFWLTSKGLGTLLLPVAKEAFNTFQGIWGTFYQKDQANADAGLREFFLGEACLKEPGFMANLGTFVDLTFRFLQHVMTGGKNPFPIQEPDSKWYALPSTMIDNILDVCDLYRDRQRGAGSGVPMGIFAQLSPIPALCTLLTVAASDTHTKDSSLRGRAIKLVHRLCLQFTSWQSLINDRPLIDEFIPCLCHAFVGVEKAIMSYYDLDHRYKYDLRIPIMELFDMCLQKEEHRKILSEFARGRGNDIFGKMLTLIINDINSQTEVAIDQMKLFVGKVREKGGPAAAAAPTVQPGAPGAPGAAEGDDDEAIYARSTIDPKEKAKKFFVFSVRSFGLLYQMVKYCPDVIVNGVIQLEQLTHSTLNYQLHWLVGPGVKDIHATTLEYELVGFDGKKMMKNVAEVYLFLADVNVEEVARVVAKDERYYSEATFAKAFRFVRKHNLLVGEQLQKFDASVKKIASQITGIRDAVNMADIPDNFLCEMMAEIMSDPVQFPQSKCIVDRHTAERAILGSDRDPYANTPCTVKDLIPMTQLKEDIHKFAKEKGIPLEGGNMFD